MAQQLQAPTSQPWHSWWRLGGIAGIAFVVLFFAASAVTAQQPAVTDDASAIRSFFEDDSGRYLVNDWLNCIVFMFLFLPFASALHGMVGAVDSSSGMWPRLTFMGAALVVASQFVASIFWGGIAASDAEGLDDSTLRAVMYLDAYAFTAIGFPAALMATASSVVIFQTRVVWRWLAFLGWASAALHIVGALWVIDGDPEAGMGIAAVLGSSLFFLWILLTGIAMVRRKQDPAD